jgi:hypothetical protein
MFLFKGKIVPDQSILEQILARVCGILEKNRKFAAYFALTCLCVGVKWAEIVQNFKDKRQCKVKVGSVLWPSCSVLPAFGNLLSQR